MGTVSTVNGPSGYCGNLDFSYPPKVQEPSPVRKIQSPPFKPVVMLQAAMLILSRTFFRHNDDSSSLLIDFS